MNFPHESLNAELQNGNIDLNAIRSLIIANASARQASSETAKKLQLSNEAKVYSDRALSITPLKARIIFFSKDRKFSTDPILHDIVKGSFFSSQGGIANAKNNKSSNYESVVNLNNSNNIKLSALELLNDNNRIVVKHSNSKVNRG